MEHRRIILRSHRVKHSALDASAIDAVCLLIAFDKAHRLLETISVQQRKEKIKPTDLGIRSKNQWVIMFRCQSI